MKLLLIGHARHGKDTTADILKELYGYKSRNSSTAAAEIFLYDALKEKYGYNNPEECFEDRVNHRQEWYELICEYNKKDRARLAKEILKDNDIYCGMRDAAEIAECQRQGIFDLIIAVYNPRLPDEHKGSFNIDLWEWADIFIPNSGTIEDLRTRIKKLTPLLQFDKKFVRERPNDFDLGGKVRETVLDNNV